MKQNAVRSPRTLDARQRRRPSGRREFGGGAGLGAQPAELRVEIVGKDRIEVSAVGAFDAGWADLIGDRLERMMAGGRSSLRIDCSAVTSMDSEIASMLTHAAKRLHAGGGRMEIIDAPEGLLTCVSLQHDVDDEYRSVDLGTAS